MIKIVIGFLALAALTASAESPYAQWSNGPDKSDDYFPIAVWLQQPRHAQEYKALGINLYVGLWSGPNESQLAELEKAQMPVICNQRLQFKDRKIIVGWMHGDEPDNAQPLPRGQKGYGPPITPEKIIADYQRIKANDPSRPVMLNLGQGVAYDNYIGRGVRRGKLEDYPEYLKGCDVVSFDIYPANHDRPEITGHLEYVPRGVVRLREWSTNQKVVWNCIECTHIHGEGHKPTPGEVRSEVWMSIIHGSRGLIYFVHQFKPRSTDAALLADPEMSKAVAQVNAQVKSLAAVINSPADPSLATVAGDNSSVPIHLTARHHGGDAYVFAAAMSNAPAGATFTLNGLNAGTVEVIGENRKIPLAGGKFQDHFDGYAVHLYKVAPR
ncbi:MAG TPA: hypothetical protein VH475_12770 [Tepidisphaeraceae bacterium]